MALKSAKIEGYEEFMGFTNESTINTEGVEGEEFFSVGAVPILQHQGVDIFVPGNVIGTRPTPEDQNLDSP